MEDPSLLILDEPFNGLDKKGVAQIHQLILELRSQNKTIILSSHGQNDIDVLCDIVCEMDAGRMRCVRMGRQGLNDADQCRDQNRSAM